MSMPLVKLSMIDTSKRRADVGISVAVVIGVLAVRCCWRMEVEEGVLR
jgi:hypothetical protein